MKNRNNILSNMDAMALAAFFPKDNATHPLIAACNAVVTCLTEGRTSDLTDLTPPLEKALGVTAAGAVLIAILVECYGFVKSAEALSQKAGITLDETELILHDLAGMDYVKVLSPEEGITLTSLSIDLLENDTPAEADPEKEFIDLLSTERDLRKDDDDGPYISEADFMMLLIPQFEQFIHRRPSSRFSRFYRKNRLDELDRKEMALFLLLCRDIVTQFTLGRRINPKDPGVKSMVNRGWAIMFAAPGEEPGALIQNSQILLDVNVCRELFRGSEEVISLVAVGQQAQIIRWSAIQEKELFYNEEDLDGVQRLFQIAEEGEFQRISERLKEYKLKVAVSALLYGAPGTGKTELARQIALRNKRNLILVDASKLQGSYWGESERNYRDLFRNYRYLDAISLRAPILFMDEAEGILSKRVNAEDSSRGSFLNIIKNIILEEMSDFNGLLLATTNNASNLDDAMDRRFLIKLEFHIPNEDSRRKIWHSKLPDLATPITDSVAREFPFSGGHIDNVATQAIIESILNNSDITLASLREFAMAEQSFSKKDGPRKIGFRAL